MDGELERGVGDERPALDEVAADSAASTVAPVEEFNKEILKVSAPAAGDSDRGGAAGELRDVVVEVADSDGPTFRAALRSELALVVQALLTAQSRDEMAEMLAAAGFRLVSKRGA